MTDDEQAKAEALYRVGQFVMAKVRHASPTARAAMSWVLRRQGGAVRILSSDMGEVQSERNGRHPVFARGPRESWTWTAQNKFHPERTRAAERAVDRAIDEAGDQFLSTYLERIAVDSPYFSVR
jgi:hypothetical protein